MSWWLQEEALLSLDMSERSVVASVRAALEKTIAGHASAAALQDCMAQDAVLRIRYVKVKITVLCLVSDLVLVRPMSSPNTMAMHSAHLASEVTQTR